MKKSLWWQILVLKYILALKYLPLLLVQQIVSSSISSSCSWLQELPKLVADWKINRDHRARYTRLVSSNRDWFVLHQYFTHSYTYTRGDYNASSGLGLAKTLRGQFEGDQTTSCEMTDLRELTREIEPTLCVQEKKWEGRGCVLNNYLMSESAAMGEADTSPGVLWCTIGHGPWFIRQNSAKCPAAEEGTMWTLTWVKAADIPPVGSNGKKFCRNWPLAWAGLQFARSLKGSIFTSKSSERY